VVRKRFYRRKAGENGQGAPQDWGLLKGTQLRQTPLGGKAADREIEKRESATKGTMQTTTWGNRATTLWLPWRRGRENKKTKKKTERRKRIVYLVRDAAKGKRPCVAMGELNLGGTAGTSYSLGIKAKGRGYVKRNVKKKAVPYAMFLWDV